MKYILTALILLLQTLGPVWAQKPELIVPVGHFGAIYSVAFSPNGYHLLTGGVDGKVKLWTIEGKEILTLNAYSAGVHSMAFSPDGQFFLTGGDDTIKLWNLHGEEIRNYVSNQPSQISSVAFSPDGKTILSGSRNGVAILWDLNGSQIRSFGFYGHNAGINSVSFSSDGKQILACGTENYPSGIVKVWNLRGVEVQKIVVDSDVLDAAISPDGQYILTGQENGSVQLWNMQGKEIHTYDGHFELAYTVAFSPDGEYVLSGGNVGMVNLSSINGEENSKIAVHDRGVSSLTFSPRGKFFLTCGMDGKAKLWNLKGEEIVNYSGHGSPIYSVTFSPNDQYILTARKDWSAKLWDLSELKIQSLGTQLGCAMDKASFSPDGKNIVTNWCGFSDLWSLQGRRFFSVMDGSLYLRPNEKYTIIFEGAEACIYEGDFNDKTDIAYISGIQILERVENQIKIVDYGGNEVASIPCINHPVQNIQDLDALTTTASTETFSQNGNYKLTVYDEKKIKLLETSTGNHLLTFIAFSEQENDWIITTPDQYYASSKEATNFIHFKIGLDGYSFEQFDLRLNRPDKILETLLPFGADSNLMLQYHQAYHKRLEKYGFTEEMLFDDYHVPECHIQNANQIPFSTTDPNLQLQIQALDSLRPLDRLNIFVNDVPLYGISGINLRDQNTQGYKTTLDIPLSKGENKIQASALNQGGAESLKATTYVTYDAPPEKPDLYLITIGTSDYQAADKDLRYAAKDARDIAALYQNADGFQEVHAKVLTDDQVTKSNILALRRWLEQSQVDDQVLLYVSGHGLIDDNYDFYYATHDIDFANPSEKGILYDEIEGLLDGIPARKKLLLMDACHSGEYDADAPPLTAAQQDSLDQKGVSFKGFSKGDDKGGPTLGLQNSFEMMQQLFADLRRGSGATVITSSAGVQVSYEDAEWQNGAFTYAFLYGLQSMKADVNGDGQVTASEIQAFVAEYVPRLTEGLQVPTFRRENLEFDFRVW